MRRFLLTVTINLLFISGFSQLEKHKFAYTTTGDSLWGYIYHPADNTKQYPAIIFFHNASEVGTTSASADKLLIQGPLKYVSSGWQPNYIIIALQYNTWSVPAALMKTALDIDSKLKNSIDKNNVFLTGIGTGASVISDWLVAGYTTKGIIPMSPLGISSFPRKSIPLWGFYEQYDKSAAKPSVLKYQQLLGGGKITVYPGNFCCWNTVYDPAWTENGKSIYDWIDSIAPPTTTTNQYRIDSCIVFYADASNILKIDTAARLLTDTTGGNFKLHEYQLSSGEKIKYNSRFVAIWQFIHYTIPAAVLNRINTSAAIQSIVNYNKKQ